MQRSAFSTARSAPSTFARASSPLSRQQLSVHAAGEKTFTVDKPLGLKLGQGANGLVVKVGSSLNIIPMICLVVSSHRVTYKLILSCDYADVYVDVEWNIPTRYKRARRATLRRLE
eukprot:1384112-Amorphochlora_amoeboformis.AAC.2